LKPISVPKITFSKKLPSTEAKNPNPSQNIHPKYNSLYNPSSRKISKILSTTSKIFIWTIFMMLYKTSMTFH
jgi:hypothetical protein